jgi:hypothetical protein
MAVTSVPITISTEANELIAELELREEFDRMLEHTVDSVRDLASVQVSVDPSFDTDDGPVVLITGHREGSLSPDDRTESQWNVWKFQTFPAEVARHFGFLTATKG